MMRERAVHSRAITSSTAADLKKSRNSQSSEKQGKPLLRDDSVGLAR